MKDSFYILKFLIKNRAYKALVLHLLSYIVSGIYYIFYIPGLIVMSVGAVAMALSVFLLPRNEKVLEWINRKLFYSRKCYNEVYIKLKKHYADENF